MTPSDDRKKEMGIKSFDQYWYIDPKTNEVRHKPPKGWSKVLDFIWRKKHKVSDMYWWTRRKLHVEFIVEQDILDHDNIPIRGFPRKYRMKNNWTITYK